MSLIIHSIGCNLNCYQCFNYKDFVSQPQNICDEEYILHEIKMNGYLSDAIIFSGGEFLKNPVDEIVLFLSDVKQIYKGLIIINTNGSYPSKIKVLNEKNLIDGFHTDMKLPYYEFDNEIPQETELILGIPKESMDMNSFLQSIEYTVQFDKGYSQIRSVKYPFMNDEVFERNKIYVQQLNLKHNKNTSYSVNEFIESEIKY